MNKTTSNDFAEIFLENLKDHSDEIAKALLRASPDGKSVCPFCGNGTGEDGTGIAFNGPTAHCFACNKGFNIFQAIEQEKNCKFREAVELCAEVLGWQLEYEESASTNSNVASTLSVPYQKPKREGFMTSLDVASTLGVTETTVRRWRQQGKFTEDLIDHNGVYWYSIERVEQLKSVYRGGKKDKVYDSSKKDYSNARSENIIINKNTNAKDKSDALASKLETPKNNLSDYYKQCTEDLFKHQKAIDYLTSRGLFDEQLIKSFRIGYDPKINCVVVPHDDFYCTRRMITEDKKLRFIHNLKGVSVALFNAPAIDTSEVIFITEGAFDALSIIKAGGQAVAIGGAGNVKILMDALKKSDNSSAIAILTDDDKAGDTAAKAIAKGLKDLKLGLFFQRVTLPKKKDANSWLVKDSAFLADFVKNISELFYIKNSFQRNRRGTILATAKNFQLIFNNDSKVKDCVSYNVFAESIVRDRQDLPWDKKGFTHPTWNDSDDKALQNYIETTYENLRSSTIYISAFDEYSKNKRFHPVRDYLNSLPSWDFTPRVERVFIDALGVEDSKYSRAVSKHWLLAAVARVFHPGCKFDYCLVFKGEQGIGKSTVASKLAVDWFSDSIDSIGNKDAIEGLMGNWIIELGEMQATRKADNEAIKSFLSRTVDKVRLPYDRRSQDFPRQCVFCATTNNEEFLKDRTGGRRFWILICNATAATTKERLDKLNKDYINQLWAEVMCYYRTLFGDVSKIDSSKLDIPADVKKVAAELQAKHTEGSELAGMVERFCDRPVPYGPYWTRLPLESRRKFFADGYTFITRTELVKLRDVKKLPADIKERIDNDLLHMGQLTELKLLPENIRNKICAAEVAYELLKIDNPAKDRRTINEINEILANLPKWWQTKGRGNDFNLYGQQRIAFSRKPKPLIK